MKYASAKEIKDFYHITGTTLKRWRDGGNIKYKKISAKKILYLLPETSEDMLISTKSVVGFVSFDYKEEEVKKLCNAYRQISPIYSIDEFYDDTYINVDDPINKNSLLNNILNKRILNILLSKPVNEYRDYNNLIFILKAAAMSKINVYVYNDNCKSFKIYTNLTTDMINSWKPVETMRPLNESYNFPTAEEKNNLTKRLIDTEKQKTVQVIKITDNECKNFKDVFCYTPTMITDMIKEKISLSLENYNEIYSLLNNNIIIEKENK